MNIHDNKRKQQNQQQTQFDILQRKVEDATKDVRTCAFFKRTLLDKTKITINNANMICDYILAMKQESNISTLTRRNILIRLVSFSKKVGLVDFDKIDRQAIKTYLTSFQKSEEDDRSHKWIGTHTIVTATIQKFYRWLILSQPQTEWKTTPRPGSGVWTHTKKRTNFLPD